MAAQLKVKRAKAKGAITRAFGFVQNIGENILTEELQYRLTSLTEAWTQLNSVEDELCAYEGSNTEEDLVAFGQYEEKYMQTAAAFAHAIRERQMVEEQNSNRHANGAVSQEAILRELKNMMPVQGDVALPKIVIPAFSGDYSAWKSFRDLYVGSIGKKKDLTLTQKFYYLVSFLTGEAADLVKHIPITDENFAEAWNKLEERYNRPHLIARSYIQGFMKLPSIASSTSKALRKIIDGADECIRGLSAIQMTERDPWLIYILLMKLDADTRQAWFAEIGARTDTKIDEFLKFLDKRFVHLEATELMASSTKQQTVVRAHIGETNSAGCLVCEEQHSLGNCPAFSLMLEGERRKFVAENSLCFVCLKKGHRSKECKSSNKCQICKARHNTLVHKSQQDAPTRGEGYHDTRSSRTQANLLVSSSEEEQGAIVASNLGLSVKRNVRNVRTIMPTVIVCAKDKTGKTVKLRALLDTGSEVSLITESCAQLIGSVRHNARLNVKGIGSSDAGNTKGCTNVTLYSCINDFRVQVNAYVLSQVTANVPARDIGFEAWEKLCSLKLADDQFNVSAPIDVLLGADVVWSILCDGKIPVIESDLVAVNTIFGWVISGQLAESHGSEIVASYTTTTTDIDMLMTRFWELDECKPMPACSKHDDPAEIHFRNTHSRLQDGRYMVELPFKTPTPKFGDTLKGAVQRLSAMQRKFVRNAEFQKEYSKFIQEYVDLGHMEVIPPEEINNNPRYYLPHHAVLKPDSSTTKLRVVFDGSHKDSCGISINESLLIGPPIQRDLFGVALRFRQYSFVFTTDITKMFRQIWVAPHHQDYQRIVWRTRFDEPIQHFRLRTVTYGTASAPFHSVRVLQQLATDNHEQYPRAAKIIANNIYVDDVMAGGESIEELFEVKEELVKLLDSGGFKLRKWYSNVDSFLESIPVEDRERLMEVKDNSCIKILGLYWNPDVDRYTFQVTNSFTDDVTKRYVLSEIARIFDIFGFLAPVVVKFKILMQNIWQLKVDWDSPLPGYIVVEWCKLRDNIQQLQTDCIPRKIFTQCENNEIHIFCDASTEAYAAVIYSVSRNCSPPSVRLVAAKTRVAPLKTVSVPRLELCAALLGARLFSSIKVALSISDENVFAWTDSNLVIHYLSSPPRRWKMFVSNRCEEILDILPRVKWGHVKTSENPADCASRGLYPAELIHHKLWWNGPLWLFDDPRKWPTPKECLDDEIPSDMLELRKINVNLTATEHDDSIYIQLLDRHSSFNKVVRIVAYVLRAISKFCKNGVENCKYLTHKELYKARMELFAAIQQKEFPKTMMAVRQGNLSKKDPLLKLSPFIDSNGVLRVGGRIDDASLPFEAKHPVILPKGEVTMNLVKELHERHLHAGSAHLFFLVRQQFWVLGARNIVRKVVHTCKRCFMQRKQTSSQVMANLPAVRIQPARAFLNSGCDFAGPIKIKMTNCRNPRICKAYICLFICLSTKAIHIELATDLTSEAFISAFLRFTARRGRCANLYSDNGTNFHGAYRVLTEMHKMLIDEARNEDIHALLANDGTTWSFIPPSSPHFGGIWESNIKSIKLHLNRVIGE